MKVVVSCGVVDTLFQFGTRVSGPSAADGIAVFDAIGFLDALTGCYRLLFFHMDGLR